MKSVITYFFNDYRHVKEAQLLQKLLALFVLYKCLYWCLDFELLFSENSIVYFNETQISIWRLPVFILFSAKSSFLSILFIGVAAISALNIFFFKKQLRLTFFILWFIVGNINNYIFCSLSAGEYLFQHLLFFAIFLSPGNNSKYTNLDKAFHNAGVIALHVQVCLIYFLAGYAKLTDADWLSGNAANDVFKVYDFSLPFLYQGSFLGSFLTYTVVAYQLLFSLLVWVKKIKKWFLLVGVLQHLFIAFVIGLPSFGFIMIVAYAIFYSPYSKSKNC